MKILCTGGSSFTGFWNIRELAERGHTVVYTLTRGSRSDYAGVRRERVEALSRYGRAVPDCRFGDERFLAALGQLGPWDLLCHHAAWVDGYKSRDFPIVEALAENTRNLENVTAVLKSAGCRHILLTGTYFENEDISESNSDPPLSPYVLSKKLTRGIFENSAASTGFNLGVCTLPNPFGPLEENRFTSYLASSWLRGEVPILRHPNLIRDNIHVSLLARVYVSFAEEFTRLRTHQTSRPSGYVESMREFAQRFARELSSRLPIDCPIDIDEAATADEPLVCHNTEPVLSSHSEWKEEKAWDELAVYYHNQFGGGRAYRSDPAALVGG